MDKDCPGWQYAIVVSKNNLYYLTGTRQEGMLIITAGGDPVFWVRRSYETACNESYFPRIMPMVSFRDAAAYHKIQQYKRVYVEAEVMPLAYLERLRKYFPFEEVRPMDLQLAKVRSVKSAYELQQMRRSGEIHQRVLEEQAPKLFREGMSEVELVGRKDTMELPGSTCSIPNWAWDSWDLVLLHCILPVLTDLEEIMVLLALLLWEAEIIDSGRAILFSSMWLVVIMAIIPTKP